MPMPPRLAGMTSSFTQKLLVVVMLACLLMTATRETNSGGNRSPPQANGHHHSEEANHVQPWSASAAAAADPAAGEGPVIGANIVCQGHGRGPDTYRLLAWLWSCAVTNFLWRCAKLAYAMFVTEVLARWKAKERARARRRRHRRRPPAPVMADYDVEGAPTNVSESALGGLVLGADDVEEGGVRSSSSRPLGASVLGVNDAEGGTNLAAPAPGPPTPPPRAPPPPPPPRKGTENVRGAASRESNERPGSEN